MTSRDKDTAKAKANKKNRKIHKPHITTPLKNKEPSPKHRKKKKNKQKEFCKKDDRCESVSLGHLHAEPKSQEERNSDRIKAALPILQERDNLVQKLKQDKVLVVIAETGSGKTTQLPQYCAEEFDGLIICTQPRGVAAMSIAGRISREYDGQRAGFNVGYRVRRTYKQGKRIMLMTDSSVVQMAQQDSCLKGVSVLIIDEAHERSLNTDLVCGIAKLVRERRPHDFHVIVASATIDPLQFQKFFSEINSQTGKLSHAPLLKVKSRKYPVRVEYNPIPFEQLSKKLVVEVVAALRRFTEGNCLVFLSGTHEIDSALKAFRNMCPKNCVAYPLYGSLPPEETAKVLSFDDQEGAQRMVAFCTNVAETSLTIPNVRLIIDTGLAKEARYDPQRRMNILEQMYISRSSADQRKGRAGRTAPGTCIRLYPAKEMVREYITPEILRSSLDSVVLNLCRFELNPFDFPFLDLPVEEDIRACVEMLEKDLHCLVVEGTKYALTDTGKLCSQLPFDPRLSHFVIMAEQQFRVGDFAAEIASILSSPDSILVMRGSTAEDTNNLRGHVASQAIKHGSDLNFLHSVYTHWRDAGQSSVGSCRWCEKTVHQDGCHRCRSKFANDNGYNNRVLKLVHSTVSEVKQLLQSAKIKIFKFQPQADPAPSLDEIIGRCLAISFPEQLAEWILPEFPHRGLFLLESQVSAVVSAQSSAMHPRENPTALALAMKVLRLPSGVVILEQVHPCQLEWLPARFQERVRDRTLSMELVYERKDIGKRYLKFLRERFEDDPHVVCEYRSHDRLIQVYCPKLKPHIRQQCIDCIDTHMETDLKKSIVVAPFSLGGTEIQLSAGLAIQDVSLGSTDCRNYRIRIDSLPPQVDSTKKLKRWISNKKCVKEELILWCAFREGSPSYGIVNLTDNDSALKLQEATSAEFSTSSLVKDHWGRVVIWTTKLSIEQSCNITNQVPVAVKRIDHAKKPFTICITTLRETYDENSLLSMLSREQCDDCSLKMLSPKNGVRIAFLNFSSSNLRDSAFQNLLQLTMKPFLLVFPNGKKKVVWTECTRQNSSSLNKYRALFQSTEKSRSFCSQINIHSTNVEFECTVIIQYPDLFNVSTTMQMALMGTAVQYTMCAQYRPTEQRIILRSSSMNDCVACATRLASLTASQHIVLREQKVRALWTELHNRRILNVWEEEMKLRIKCEVNASVVHKITICGKQSNQGNLLFAVGEYFDEFQQRYHSMSLDSRIASLFRVDGAGTAQLNGIRSRFTSEAEISFVHSCNLIEILMHARVPNSSSVLQCIQHEIEAVLQEIGQLPITMDCVSCGKVSDRQITICGHICCSRCLKSHIVGANMFPITCPKYDCGMHLSIDDVKLLLSPTQLEDAALASLRAHLYNHPEYAMCITGDCCGIIRKSKGYASCQFCLTAQCAQCNVKDIDSHAGKTCEEFRQLLRLQTQNSSDFLAGNTCRGYPQFMDQRDQFDISSLIDKARKFVECNWMCNGTKILQVHENPGLKLGCPAMQRYLLAATHLGGFAQLESAVFAWHGTTSMAIPSICHHGFDPARRGGQILGRGEYFGETPMICLKYCRGDSWMILAQLLNGNHKNSTNSCFVMDNPLDWKHSYCLPILVVEFDTGTQAAPLQFIDSR